MTKFVLDSNTAKSLVSGGKTVELCDPQGKTVGYFYPVADPNLYRVLNEMFTDEELDRAASEPGGRSLKEILADLERNP